MNLMDQLFHQQKYNFQEENKNQYLQLKLWEIQIRREVIGKITQKVQILSGEKDKLDLVN